MPTVVDQNTYILPNEVMEVRTIFRRSVGSRSGGGDGGSIFEPFNLAYTNTYLLSGSNMGGLATYDMFQSVPRTSRKNVWSFIEFKWNSATKQLTLLQRPRAEETLMLYAYNYRPDRVFVVGLLGN